MYQSQLTRRGSPAGSASLFRACKRKRKAFRAAPERSTNLHPSTAAGMHAVRSHSPNHRHFTAANAPAVRARPSHSARPARAYRHEEERWLCIFESDSPLVVCFLTALLGSIRASLSQLTIRPPQRVLTFCRLARSVRPAPETLLLQSRTLHADWLRSHPIRVHSTMKDHAAVQPQLLRPWVISSFLPNGFLTDMLREQ